MYYHVCADVLVFRLTTVVGVCVCVEANTNSEMNKLARLVIISYRHLFLSCDCNCCHVFEFPRPIVFLSSLIISYVNVPSVFIITLFIISGLSFEKYERIINNVRKVRCDGSFVTDDIRYRINNARKRIRMITNKQLCNS